METPDKATAMGSGPELLTREGLFTVEVSGKD
jgi:hypothetical protein